VIALLASLALADEVDFHVLVEEDRRVEEARKALDHAIRGEGYFPGIALGERTFYMPLKVWKPKVTVHDEGMVRVKARAVQPMFITPTVPPMVVGTWDSPRKARSMESRLLEAIHPDIVAWREAMSDRGQVFRQEEIRGVLLALSELPIDQQKAGISALWLNTADNEAGEEIRILLETFALEAELPFTAVEVKTLNDNRAFERAWEPEYLGHDSWRQPVSRTPTARRETEPECLESVPPPVAPSGLSAEILTLRPPKSTLPPPGDVTGRIAYEGKQWAEANDLILDEQERGLSRSTDPCR